MTIEQLQEKLEKLRNQLEPAFSADTALGPYNHDVPSTGHCAAVAAIVNRQIGGSFVSAHVSGISHWFNRFRVDGSVVDADITGDQFGFPKLRIADKDKLFAGTRERSASELNEETRKRSQLLAERAGIAQ